MRSHQQHSNRPAIWLMVIGIMAVTVIAKTRMPPPDAAQASLAARISPSELAAHGLIRELASAMISADENAYLALWHFEGENAPRRKARAIEQFRERPDRRREVASGLLAALVQPNALRVTGVDESMATFDYTYRNFRRNRAERLTLVTVDGVWRITRVF